MRFRLLHGRWVTAMTGLVLCFAIVWLSVELRSSRGETSTVREAMRAQEFAITRNREALRELCRTNGIMTAIIGEDLDIRREMLENDAVPKPLRARWRTGISIYQGFLEQLAQQTACAEVVHP